MRTIPLQGGQINGDTMHLGSPDGNILSILLPLYGPGDYIGVMAKIACDNLLLPTTGEVLTLLDIAMKNEKELHCSQILKHHDENYFWTGTKTQYLEEGAVVYDLKHQANDLPLSTLLELAQTQDSKVRFVEPGYPTGLISLKDAIKNPFVIAQIGEAHIETFLRVSARSNKNEVLVYQPYESDPTIPYYSVISDFGSHFRLHADIKNGGGFGYAPGILPPPKPKNPKRHPPYPLAA